MTVNRIAIALLGATALSAAAFAQAPGGAMNEGPLDVSADNLQVFEAEGRAVYSGDVNAVRGATRLRADRVDVFFRASDTGAFEAVTRLVAEGQVYYVTAGEVAHGEHGVYNVETETITLTGNVVLTQGCNVSTGSRLVADLATGVSRLQGNEGAQSGGRVRSVFFPGAQDEVEQGDCEMPTPPGDGPQAFENG
ncbi:MAG: LptA/OstA family protein [Pseudomonadota bacterium]